ncbi:MAG: SufE family protein [Flavobacteriia bacterium]|jgi:cysteine desulfuration protein SufE|nr:SufE family protein [Flavobacteriia bacterium]NBP28146.1 SufE family protein [Flavobacteriia bacterium]
MIKSINELQDEVIEEFALFDDWMEKYEYIIDLGKDLPLIEEAKKTEDRLIHGCQSRVWVEAEVLDDRMCFTADSEAIITKGIISLLIRVLSNQTPENIVKSELYFIGKIGLQEHLSPTRANGLVGMINRLKSEALKQLAK